MHEVVLEGVEADRLVRGLPALARGAGVCLLDSAAGEGWSVLAVGAGRLVANRAGARWQEGLDEETSGGRLTDPGRELGDPRTALAEALAPRRPRAPGAPFSGGWIGFLGYGAGAWTDAHEVASEDPEGPPDACLLWAEAAACLGPTGRLVLRSDGRRDPWCPPDPQRAQRAVAALRRALEAPPASPPPAEDPPRAVGLPDPRPYHQAVLEAREAIARGDVFQVNLARRFELAEVARPWPLYLRLRARNAAPYAGFFQAGELALLSCSPELLLRVEGKVATTCPIAGTHARGGSEAEDRRLREALRAHPKERAEHVMMVDLERNDLGRVARPGSVEVAEFLEVHSFATVHHLVSTVRAELAEGVDPFRALAAVFPGGTITGAPKIRATELIRQLEAGPRGPYTGSLGFVDAGGDQEWNILIRTLVAHAGRAWVHGGAGIVWDSVPEREARECVQKVRSFLDVSGVDAAGADLEGVDGRG